MRNLPWNQAREQNDSTVCELQCIMMHAWRILIDMPEPGDGLSDFAGRQEGDLPFKLDFLGEDQLRTGTQAHRNVRLAYGRKAAGG